MSARFRGRIFGRWSDEAESVSCEAVVSTEEAVSRSVQEACKAGEGTAADAGREAEEDVQEG